MDFKNATFEQIFGGGVRSENRPGDLLCGIPKHKMKLVHTTGVTLSYTKARGNNEKFFKKHAMES